MISYLFRVIRLVLFIFTISYFIGTLWYIFVWLLDPDSHTNNFFDYFNLSEMKETNNDFDR